MHQLTIPELAHALRQREFSSVELTTHYLNRIQQQRDLNCFIHVDEDYALKAAGKADQQLQSGQAKPLTGIPLAHKDIFCTEHLPTTCGSKMLANFTAPYQASLVAQLAAEGAVLLGKTNMDEFAMGSSNENSYFGAVKNPWAKDYVPGGSSGGSAAAVAARLVPFATGSDTGGSIRQPAAFCGVSGIKPTYGLVSRFGMVAFASSLDQAGPIAKTVEELALVLQAMAGFDEKDSTSMAQTLPDYTKALNTNLTGLRIGLPSYCSQKDVAVDIQQAIADAVHILQQAGAKIIPLTFTTQSLWVPCYYVIACAEASSNLSRYDGIRFGYRSQQAKTAKELISRSRSEGFGLEVKRRILTGTHVLSSGYFDAYYLQALKIRRLIQNELQACFKQVDLILGPTTPTPAFKLGEKTSVVERYLGDVFTVLANLTGIPALAIPVGFSAGLPIGMQLMANHFNEARLFSLGHYYQQQTNWHQASPTDDR